MLDRHTSYQCILGGADKMTIKERQDAIVQRYGLEAEETILFFQMCEEPKGEGWDLYIELLFEYLMGR